MSTLPFINMIFVFRVFCQYCIIEAIFSYFNLRLSQKAGSFDTFLKKLCSKSIEKHLESTGFLDFNLSHTVHARYDRPLE